MKCQFCGTEISEDAAFCPECGKKQETPAMSTAFCPKCGNQLEEGCDFCPKCGARIKEPDAGKIKEQHTASPAPPAPKNPKGKGHIVILVFLLAAIVIVALVVFAVRSFLLPDRMDTSETVNSTLIDEAEENDNEDTDNEEIDLSEVDYNLLENTELSLDGIVKTAKNGGKVLQWKEELTFYGPNESGQRILMEDTTTAYIEGSVLPPGFLDKISANKQISMKGNLYFSDNNLYISPVSVYDTSGKDMVAEYIENQAREEAEAEMARTAEYDYVLPQSSSRLLSGSDVAGLSLREINYAKNEIYARHGRLFDSPELQNYFNSKGWYRGTISPGSFSESLLSNVEKKNVEYLKEIEFSMNPDGYQLDAN